MGSKIRVPAKWVLIGEHVVLRGATAITLPHPEFALEVDWDQGTTPFQADPFHIQDTVLSLYAQLAQRAPVRPLQGLMRFQNSIPIRAGVGSSAALCVALVRLCVDWASLEKARELDPSWLDEDGDLLSSEELVQQLARILEDTFHGKSSGMDVAAVSFGAPMSFDLEGGASPLGLRRLPEFRFTDTGLRASTRECVLQVQEWFRADEVRARQADLELGQASLLARKALKEYDSGSTPAGLQHLAEAMQVAHTHFERWGLLTDSIREQVRSLRKQGALAVKLTGAGKGGFLVSLWEH